MCKKPAFRRGFGGALHKSVHVVYTYVYGLTLIGLTKGLAFGMCASPLNQITSHTNGNRTMLHAIQELLDFIQEARAAHLEVANQ